MTAYYLLQLKICLDWLRPQRTNETEKETPEDRKIQERNRSRRRRANMKLNDPAVYQREREVSAARSKAYRRQQLPNQVEKDRKLARLRMQRMRLVCCW